MRQQPLFLAVGADLCAGSLSPCLQRILITLMCAGQGRRAPATEQAIESPLPSPVAVRPLRMGAAHAEHAASGQNY